MASTSTHDPLFLSRVYERLTRKDAPAQADLIFVLAGKIERKQYGIELYRAGFAPRLLLSVGRFEVSKMPALGLEGTAELLAKRDQTSPRERHFFCDIDMSGMRIHTAGLRSWNTYGEAVGLREYLANGSTASAIIVSTDIHLRRVAAAFEAVFRGLPLIFHYCPVPASASSLQKREWWTRPDDRKFVITETLKLAAYRVILQIPDRAVQLAMRLRN